MGRATELTIKTQKHKMPKELGQSEVSSGARVLGDTNISQ